MPNSAFPSTLDDVNQVTQRSNEADDILSQRPAWIVQWSSIIFMGIVAILFFIAWIIRYPDVIEVPFKLTSIDPPKPVYAKTTAKITHLLVRENEVVRSQQVLGYIESQASPKQINFLKQRLTIIQSLINTSSHSNNNAISWPALPNDQDNGLGELQSSYQSFVLAYTRFLNYQPSGYYDQKLKILEIELKQLRDLAKNMKVRYANVEKDLALAKIEFYSQQQIYSQKAISTNDFHKEESKLLSKRLPVQEAEALIISNLSDQSAKQKEILELRNDITEQKSQFLETVKSLQAALDAWDIHYVLRAPTTGTVTFVSFLDEGQLVTNQQEVLYITQSRGREYGEVLIHQHNFGKIKIGQRTRIKFAGYPDDEFGTVQGQVAFISEIPNKNGMFLARVALPSGLITNYRKKLVYKSGMQANAEIITENTRLLDRLFYKLRRNIQH